MEQEIIDLIGAFDEGNIVDSEDLFEEIQEQEDEYGRNNNPQN